MKEMIQARKEQLEARGISGFTLMEMLIVVAIIAILIAIAIPVFTTQLNSAKQSADEANARSLYAEATAMYMTDSAAYTAPTVSDAKPYTVTYEGTTYTFSDVCTELTVGTNATTNAPIIRVTTNKVATEFGADA